MNYKILGLISILVLIVGCGQQFDSNEPVVNVTAIEVEPTPVNNDSVYVPIDSIINITENNTIVGNETNLFNTSNITG